MLRKLTTAAVGQANAATGPTVPSVQQVVSKLTSARQAVAVRLAQLLPKEDRRCVYAHGLPESQPALPVMMVI